MIRQMQRQKKGKDITEKVELLDEKKKDNKGDGSIDMILRMLEGT